MVDILDKFIEKAKENVASGYYEKAAGMSMGKISLRDKLINQEFTLISEIKHASPAGEYSYDNIDVEKTAKLFRDAGADAVSCVVEPQVFKGNLDNIPIAKRTGLPVLFKDFVIDKRQIKAASAVGADTILLVMKVMDRLGLNADEMIDKAHMLGLEVLLECYNVDELRRALKTKADILGINNRDLQTLKVDITVTKKILDEAGIDSLDRPLISESGIKTREDAQYAKDTGAKGILVGTALWKADDMFAKVKELKIK